jgi:hypothetical protein
MRCLIPRRVAALTIALTFFGGLTAGCTSSSAPKKTETPAPSSISRPTPSKTSPTLQQNPLPKTLPTNQPKVRGNVVQTKCAAIPGGWSAAGTVKNPDKKKRTYHILVFFTTTHATTLDFASTKVTVPAGKTAKWQAQKKFAAQKKMLCPMPSISAT